MSIQVINLNTIVVTNSNGFVMYWFQMVLVSAPGGVPPRVPAAGGAEGAQRAPQ